MLQGRYGWRARIGVITVGLGITLTREWGSLLPEGISFHTTLMELVETVPEKLSHLKEKALGEARKLASPGLVDMLLFACTSGSFIGGAGYDREITTEIETATGVPTTTTTTCVLTAFEDLGIKSIALVGPYVSRVLEIEVQFLKQHGVQTAYCYGLDYAMTAQIARTGEEPYTYYRLAKEAYRAVPEVDAIFVTCMASPIARVVGTLEQETGKPVISSCSASLYGVLKLLGIRDPVENYGQLLQRQR